MAQQLLCQWFVDEWKAGKRPDIAVVLQDIDPQRRKAMLAQLLKVEVTRRRENGEEPKADEYIQRFPSDQVTILAAFDAASETLIEPNLSGKSRTHVSLPQFRIGQRLGKYEITSILGEGGMGVVYGARDTVIRREVAIKQVSCRHVGKEAALSRLLQEARAAGSLHHPNIVMIFDAIEQDDTLYLVMEKVNGSPLSDVLQKSGSHRMDWRTATAVMIDCCDALDAAHAQGLIHRDIKPQNIMLTTASRAKLLDFGLAKIMQSDQTALTAVGTIVGTPDYMSPEQFRGDIIDARCDLYSLGATYFTLLTGRAPFETGGNHLKTMYAHCNEPVPSVVRLAPDVPAGCEAVVRRAMEKNPADRFQTAVEVKQRLQELLSTGGQAMDAVVKPKCAPKRRWLSVAVAGGIALAACAAIGIGSFFRSPRAVSSTSTGDEKEPKQTQPVAMAVGQGVTADTILLGTSTAYSGPNAETGRGMVEGMRTCFAAVNTAGGIHGRKLELQVLDDRYEPARSLANMRELFEDRRVFAVIGNVGTATSLASVPYALEHKYLFFAPFTGARLLRNDPPDRYVFHYRASYGEEVAVLVRYFAELRQIPPEKIAVLAQNDSYGDDGFSGVARALRKYRIHEEDILRVGHERNSVDVDHAVQELLNHRDRVAAVIMVTTYKPAARFIRQVKEKAPDMVFGAVSFVGSKSLSDQFQEMGPEYGDGVIMTQVVPYYMSNSTGVLRYRELLKKHFPEYRPGFVSLEGFIAAECLVEGLRKAGPGLTTERLVDALESIDGLDLGIGPIIHFSPSRHQASDKVWATRLLKSGEFEVVPLD